MVKCIPLIYANHDPCESCILSKHHRNTFSNVANYRAKAPFELFHIDLCGLMQTKYIGRIFYFLTFIDDFSRMTWVYFIKNKSKTFAKFREFKA